MQSGGENSTASVASAFTATTTKAMSAVLPLYSGTTVEVASVAEAPHTAVPTPTSAPNPALRPYQRATTNPDTTVAAIAMTISAAVCRPSAAIPPSPTRSPSNATAQRSSVFTQKFMPGCTTGRAASGLSAMPTTSAIPMVGMGAAFATHGAALSPMAATKADRIMPGARAATIAADGRRGCRSSALTGNPYWLAATLGRPD